MVVFAIVFRILFQESWQLCMWCVMNPDIVDYLVVVDCRVCSVPCMFACTCVGCVFLGSCLATNVFIGNLLATGRGWIIIVGR